MYCFSKICLLCLNATPNLIDFHAKYKNTTYFRMFKDVVPKLAKSISNLPSTICYDCSVRLRKSYVFHRRCLYHRRQLNVYLQQMNSQNMKQTKLLIHAGIRKDLTQQKHTNPVIKTEIIKLEDDHDDIIMIQDDIKIEDNVIDDFEVQENLKSKIKNEIIEIEDDQEDFEKQQSVKQINLNTRMLNPILESNIVNQNAETNKNYAFSKITNPIMEQIREQSKNYKGFFSEISNKAKSQEKSNTDLENQQKSSDTISINSLESITSNSDITNDENSSEKAMDKSSNITELDSNVDLVPLNSSDFDDNIHKNCRTKNLVQFFEEAKKEFKNSNSLTHKKNTLLAYLKLGGNSSFKNDFQVINPLEENSDFHPTKKRDLANKLLIEKKQQIIEKCTSDASKQIDQIDITDDEIVEQNRYSDNYHVCTLCNTTFSEFDIYKKHLASYPCKILMKFFPQNEEPYESIKDEIY